MSKGFCFQPGGPAETGGLAQTGGRNLLSAKDKLDVPEKMLAAIIEHPIFDPLERVAPRQHALVIGKAHRPESHAETELGVPETRARNGVYAQGAAFRRFAQAAKAVGWQRQPAPGEGLDFGRDVKILEEDGLQSLGVAGLAG